MSIKLNPAKNTYDEVPYQSYPYAQSQPENLRTIGILFGMNPPALETARVLELGCAEGGNIIPHAVKYPKAKFIGVDLSKVQIEAGKKHTQSLGLKNIELKNCSITEIDDSFGEFDYIICHGVISWVPAFVRDKIFQVASKNLSKNGIAYISYNTLPGWNMIRTIRDMMLYHGKIFDSPQEKITQARLLLDFVKDALEGKDTPYAQVLRSEAELLSEQSDHYLRHDHLEEDNKQYYFSEFIGEAGKVGLQYLGDCLIPTMYAGNMPTFTAEKLKDLNDIIRTEQYMDFINNRRFRSTLLCHRDVAITRSLNADCVRNFTLSLHAAPEEPEDKTNLNNNETIKFYFDNDKESFISASSPGLKASLYVLSEYQNSPLSFNDIAEKATKKLKKGFRKEDVEAELINNLLFLAVKGYVNLSLTTGNKDKANMNKPKVNKMAYYQATATNNNWVTNLRHSSIAINHFDKFIIKYMDGKNSKEDIISSLIQDVKDKKIIVSKDGGEIQEETAIKTEVSAFLESTIDKFSRQALLE